MRKGLSATAAVLVAVIFFLLVSLPPRPRIVPIGDAALAQRTVAGAYHIHSVRSDGAAIAGDRGGGGARRIEVRHPHRPWGWHRRSGCAGIHRRRAVHRRGRAQHEWRPLRRAGTWTGTLSARRGPSRGRRRCLAAGRVRFRGAPGLEPTRARLERLDAAIRRDRMDERGQRMAQRDSCAPRASGFRLLRAARPGARVHTRSTGIEPGALGRAHVDEAGVLDCRP